MAINQRVKIGPWGACPLALLRDANVTPNMTKVYIALSAFQGTNDSCWPSRDEIAEATGLSPSSVSQATTALVKAGWIARKRRPRGHQTNRYVVLNDFEEAPQEPVIAPEGGAKKEAEDVQENRISGKPEHPGDPEAECPGNPDIPPITTTPLYNTTIPSAAAPGPEALLSPLKDPLANSYQNAFTARTPASAWKSIPQERRHLNDLAKRTHRLAGATGGAPEQLAAKVLAEFAEMKRIGRSEYWRNAPWTPSALTARWDAIIESMSQNADAEEVMIF